MKNIGNMVAKSILRERVQRSPLENMLMSIGKQSVTLSFTNILLSEKILLSQTRRISSPSYCSSDF